MSQNNPFVFTAGSGQVPPVQPQQNSSQVSNLQHQNQPALAQPGSLQQMAQLSGMDMSALEGISPEQLAAIARLFQSGAIQMPPPTLNLPTNHIEPTAQSAPTSLPPTSSVPPASQAQATTTMREDVSMDTEEGEVNESEEGNTPAKMRDFLHPPPTGPKNRSLSPWDRVHGNPKHRASPRPPIPPVTNSKKPTPQHLQNQQASKVVDGSRPIGKDYEAKLFVLEIVKAGYSFEDILPDVRNPKSLSRMFKELGLPTPSSQAVHRTSQQNSAPSPHGPSQGADGMTRPREDLGQASLIKRPAPAKPAAADRSAYLARLQAAKNKKADATVPPENKPEPIKRSEYLAKLQAARNKKSDTAAAASTLPEPASDPRPIDAITTLARESNSALRPGSQDAGTSTGQPALAGKSATMTELARQKLEALMARRAAKQNRNATPSPTPESGPIASSYGPSSSSQTGLGAGLAEIPAQMVKSGLEPPPAPTTLRNVSAEAHPLPPTQQPVSPTPPTPSRSFSGLPGLFMFDTTAQAQVPAPTSQSPSAFQPLPQPVSYPPAPQTQTYIPASSIPPSTSMTLASAAPSTVPRKRAVASDFDDDSKPNSAKRPFGQSLNASEDESLVIQVSDEEDEDEDMESEPLPEPSSQTRLQTKSFRDVGPLRDFPPRPISQVQTSTPSTPGGVTYEQKMKQIEEFKRMIAEKEKKQKANGKGLASNLDASGGISGPSFTPRDESSIDNSEAGYMPSLQDRPFAIETSSLDSSTQPIAQSNVYVHSHSASTDRPVSATQLAKQQEKERLRQRLLQLEQEELNDLNEAVAEDVPAASPEREMPGGVSDEPLQLDPNQATPPQILGGNTTTEKIASGTASEEGELSDDSMSKFYDQQDAKDDETQDVPSGDASKVESQATTTGDRSSAEPLSGFESLSHDASKKESVVAPVSSSQPSMTRVTEYRTDIIGEDGEVNDDPYHPTTDVVHDNLATPESLLEDEMQQDSDEDDGDQDQSALKPSYTPNARLSDSCGSPGDTSEDGGLDSQGSASHPSSRPENLDDASVAFISEPGRIENDNSLITADDLAPEIQPNDHQQRTIPDQNPVQPMSYFSPYRSPLAQFKDYRYHPEYLDTVAGGYQSMTYNHNIDPTNTLCPFETAGGKCNDTNCQHQHFKSNTELLKSMGTKNIPAHSPDELKKWNEGLGAVVRELRNTQLDKNAGAIAARIAEFRRDFVGDPTKILNLG